MEKQGTSEWKSWHGLLRSLCLAFVAWSRLTLDVKERGIRIPFLLSFINRTQEHDFITRQTRNDSHAEQIQRQQQPLVPSLNPAPKHMLSCDWCPWCPGARSSCRSRKLTIVLNARCHCRTYCCMHEKTCLSIPCNDVQMF